ISSILCFSPVAPLKGRRMPAACDKEKNIVDILKNICGFFICGSYAIRFRPRSIPKPQLNRFLYNQH
ncbi:MAG: hypothetical protein QXS02_04935, partial [Candidatus Thermoplasmatota archaeon]